MRRLIWFQTSVDFEDSNFGYVPKFVFFEGIVIYASDLGLNQILSFKIYLLLIFFSFFTT